MLQWHIDYTRTFSPEDELTADLITKRILLFTIGAMVTPAMGLTHLVFNLFSADTPDLIDELRDEILTVMQQYQGQWSIEALNKMCKLDSAIKESLRISCFGTRVCARRVILSLPKEVFCRSSNAHRDSGTRPQRRYTSRRNPSPSWCDCVHPPMASSPRRDHLCQCAQVRTDAILQAKFLKWHSGDNTGVSRLWHRQTRLVCSLVKKNSLHVLIYSQSW